MIIPACVFVGVLVSSYDAAGGGFGRAHRFRCSHALTVRSAPWAQRARDRFDGVARAQRSMIPQRARGLFTLFDAPAQCLRTLVGTALRPTAQTHQNASYGRVYSHTIPITGNGSPFCGLVCHDAIPAIFTALATPATRGAQLVFDDRQQRSVPYVQRCCAGRP